LLQSVIDKSLSTALQQFSKRRIGENKIKTTVDDILNIWSTIDEKGALDKVPVFCTGDTSRFAMLSDELSDMAYMRKTIDDLKKQVEVLTDVVMQLNNRQVSSCHCSPRPKNDLIENNAVYDTSALSVDQHRQF